MSSQNHRFTRSADISQEFLVFKYYNGIKLIRPEKGGIESLHHYDLGYAVSHLFQSAFNVYAVDINGIHRASNQANADNFWDLPINKVIGKTIFDRTDRNNAIQVQINDKKVIHSEMLTIMEDAIESNPDCALRTLTIRLPWYQEDNKIIGIFGFSITVGKQSMSESLLEISNLNLLSLKKVKTKSNSAENSLSKMQENCLIYLTMGLSAQQIANKLGLSKRTVEYYLNIIKNKLNCDNKASLIQKALRMENIRNKLLQSNCS